MAEKKTKASQNETGEAASARATSAANAVSAKLSGPLAPLEKKLDEVLNNKAPFQIPKKGREAIVKYSPWIGLVVGALGLLAALTLWNAGHRVNQLVDFANQISATYGGHVATTHLGLSFWLSLILLILTSVVAIVAFPVLKARKKTGWNLLFYSSLLNFAYGLVSLFYDGGGFGNLVSSLVSTTIGLYILFQIRSYYK